MTAWAALLGAAAGACDRREKTPTERGAGVFLRSCSGCHGADGRGIARAGFGAPPRNLRDPAWQASVTDEAIRASIVAGKGTMPSFGALLEPASVDDVIAFIRTLPEAKR